MSGDDLRERARREVFRQIVIAAGESEQLSTALGSLGFFAAMSLVDGITDGVVDALAPEAS